MSPSAAFRGVNEPAQQSLREVNGWRYLTRLSSNCCLLEKNNQLILLPIDRLINQIRQQKTTSNNSDGKPVKLIFPEIISCFDETEAKCISEILEQDGLVTSVFEKQVTLLEIPLWIEGLPIKELSLELAISISTKPVRTHLPLNEFAELTLCLLKHCDDFSELNLRQLSPDNLICQFKELLIDPNSLIDRKSMASKS